MGAVIDIQDLSLLEREDVKFFEQVSNDLSMFDKSNIRFAHHVLENGTVVQRKMYNKGCAMYKVSDINGSTRYYDTPVNSVLIMRLFRNVRLIYSKAAKIHFAKTDLIKLNEVLIVTKSNEEAWSKISYDFPEMFDPRGSTDINKIKHFWEKLNSIVFLTNIKNLTYGTTRETLPEIEFTLSANKCVHIYSSTNVVKFVDNHLKVQSALVCQLGFQATGYLQGITNSLLNPDNVLLMQRKNDLFTKLIKEVAYFSVSNIEKADEGYKAIPFSITDWINIKTDPVSLQNTYGEKSIELMYQSKTSLSDYLKESL